MTPDRVVSEPFVESEARGLRNGEGVTDARRMNPMRCRSCRRDLVTGEPVWLGAGGRRVTCGHCIPPPARSGYRAARCVTCARFAHVPAVWQRQTRFCSDLCAGMFRNAVRRARSESRRRKVCATCQRSFIARRMDARVCGSACRQRAYRQRHMRVPE